MSILHLFWIIPVSWAIGAFSAVMCIMASQVDAEDADYYEGSMQ